MDSSTIIRRVTMTVMLLGPNGPVVDRMAARFEESHIRVVRAVQVVEACDRLAVAMPQVVVVLGALRPDEREALSDRATAVGALILDVDPGLDEDTLNELVTSAAKAAIERRLRQDEATAQIPVIVELPDEDVDSKW